MASKTKTISVIINSGVHLGTQKIPALMCVIVASKCV